MQKVNLILASGSPRRREILTQGGFDFTVLTSETDEKTDAPDPEEKVRLLSQKKAEAVCERLKRDGEAIGREKAGTAGPQSRKGTAVVGADTLVACDGKILGKPGSREEAIRMITLLQGHTHEVYTGVTVHLYENGTERSFTFCEKTQVHVAPMTGADIEEYVDTKEPYDKAGGYGIQGRFAMYVDRIDGDYYTVVGFPLARFCREMRKKGLM